MKMRKRRIVFRVTINFADKSKPDILMIGPCRNKHYHNRKSWLGWNLK